ncbi:hypothetical protein KGQ19_15450 [Catenulispora sp. NL8]|uniref:Uncharacterized protein n=1 Tax=Catenulispora pinistramenti TaxID=2705254 RepID=A0ABS5KQH5_9ACTN|nr:hypothetical protein [Catenulispora pinistramenti]MBS2548260.1 hypothetical protein [Catenulispora pinistramenti]
MYLLYLALTSPSRPSPGQTDAEQLEDRIWARANPGLGIQHLHAKARARRIDLAVYLAGVGPTDPPDTGSTPVQNILALIPEWTVSYAAADREETTP